MDFLDMGFGEIILILFVALIVLGPGKIVGVAKGLGHLIYNFRKISSEFANQITDEFREQERNIVDATNNNAKDIKEQNATCFGDARQLVKEIGDLKTEFKRDKSSSDE